MNRSIRHTLLAATTACGLWLAPATAQTAATTDPVGAMTVILKPGSDNLFGVPFRRTELFSGVVSEVSQSSVDQFTVTVDSSGSSVPLLDSPTYLRFTTGELEGVYLTVLGRSDDSISVESLGLNISSITPGDSFRVEEYWTLGTLFPPGSFGVGNPLILSTGPFPPQRGSEILMRTGDSNGINVAPNKRFFALSEGWFSTLGEAADEFVILPESFLILRQPAGVGTRQLIISGSAPSSVETVFLYSDSDGKDDNYVSQVFPIDKDLNQLEFGESFVESTGFFPPQRGDELLFYDDVSGINPAPTKRFFKFDGDWYDAGEGTVANSFTIPGGSPLIVRKAATESGETSFWSIAPPNSM